MNKYQMYGGEVELTFDEYRHKYTANGEPVDGTTTILKSIAKPALVPWCAKMSSEYVARSLYPGIHLDEVSIQKLVLGTKNAHKVRLEDAGNLGTMGHAWAESFLKNENPPMPLNPELRGIATAVMDFAKKHEFRVISTERKLYSRDLQVAGTADIICEFEGNLAVADFKTGSGVYSEVFLQLGAYSIAYAEETGEQAKAHVAINVRKTGELYVGTSYEVERNENAFRSVLDLNRALSSIEEERKQIVRKVA